MTLHPFNRTIADCFNWCAHRSYTRASARRRSGVKRTACSSNPGSRTGAFHSLFAVIFPSQFLPVGGGRFLSAAGVRFKCRRASFLIRRATRANRSASSPTSSAFMPSVISSSIGSILNLFFIRDNSGRDGRTKAVQRISTDLTINAGNSAGFIGE